MQSKDRPQTVMDTNRLLVEHFSNPWDLFSKYHPEFKTISRVRHFLFITNNIKFKI